MEWRSYLLRPRPRAEPRDAEGERAQLEKFRRYAASWRRPAAEPDSARFRFWDGSARPPTHSVPAHVVAKAAARLGPGEFAGLHEALLDAYFAANRDISDAAELERLWSRLGIPAEHFPALDSAALLAEVMDDHRDALDRGANGVPAVMMVGNEAVVVGAQPLEIYRRWITRTLERLSEN